MHCCLREKYSLKTSSFLAIISAALLVVATLNVNVIGAHYFNCFIQPILMIAFLWFGYDVIAEKWGAKEYPSSLSGVFVVYCLHLITICWVQGVLRISLGVGPAARLLGYFASWMTFGLDIWIVNLLKCRLPKAYVVLSGGRGLVRRGIVEEESTRSTYSQRWNETEEILPWRSGDRGECAKGQSTRSIRSPRLKETVGMYCRGDRESVEKERI